MIFHQKQNTFGTKHFSYYIYENTIWDKHFHKDFEIIYIISGSIRCQIGDICCILSQGDFAMCLPYEIHSYIPSENAAYAVWGFSEYYVKTFSAMVKEKTADSFKFNCCEEVKNYIFNITNNYKDLPICSLKSILYALCSEYLKCVTLTERDKKANRIYDILLFIENNYQSQCTLSDAANYLGYDYHYVSRYFKKQFGMNFGMFLTTYRLQRAIELLEESEKTITDIAYESGFQSVRAFNECFRNHIGKSPSQYRKDSNRT